MANTLAPFGFMPVRRQDGSAWTGNMTVRKIASGNGTAIFKGDVVKGLTTGYIAIAAAGDTQIAGVFVGCKYLSTSQSRTVWSNYWPGSDAAADAEAYIIDDPGCVFLAQTFSATNKAALTTIGNTAKLIANPNSIGTGSTLTGLSTEAIDMDTVSNSAGPGFQFRVVDVPGVQTSIFGAALAANAGVNGYDNTSVNNYVLVTFNAQDMKLLTGS